MITKKIESKKYFTRKEFYENRYRQLENDFLLIISEYFIANQNELKKQFIGFLQENFRLMQEKCFIAQQCHLSLLYTSFFAGEMNIYAFLYDKHGDMQRGIAWGCQAIFQLWRDFTKKVADERYYIRSIIHPSMFRPFYVATVRKVMAIIGENIKLWITNELREILPNILHNDDFLITLGEYNGEREILFRMRPQVELIRYIGQRNLPDDILNYRYFDGGIYRQSRLEELNLQNSYFENCLFEPWQFYNVDLRNVLFRNCRFHLTDFFYVQLSGALFEQCTFMECVFHKVTGAFEATEECVTYPLFFTECSFRNVRFVACDLYGVNVSGCKFDDVIAETCNFDREDSNLKLQKGDL
ncbi:MAG: pentapeptide repeat-containing protein [Selenomonas ruminantium]|jgi:hypothetical protein|nr:pentapeptide repeat-containing protein [Selenomonas ruminantium]